MMNHDEFVCLRHVNTYHVREGLCAALYVMSVATTQIELAKEANAKVFNKGKKNEKR